MPIHFGVKLRESKYGFHLNEDNYAVKNNKSSFVAGEVYSDQYCDAQYIKCMENYHLNMRHFLTLNHEEMEHYLKIFIDINKFEEVKDLNCYNGISGYYVMVLDKYNQIYIGTTKNIMKRIRQHWSKQKEFDRLIFGDVGDSILAIDSFRAFDTTRIYAIETNSIYDTEDRYISQIPSKFLCNRTAGGLLKGLSQAIKNGKTRDM